MDPTGCNRTVGSGLPATVVSCTTHDCTLAAPSFEQVCDNAAVDQATILHADLDSFYASVEQRDDPRLRGRPVLVGDGRGAGGQLRGEGLRRPDADGRDARPGRCARDAVVVPPRMSAYSAASKAVFAVFRDTTPIVEGISIDEAFLEVGGLLQDPRHAHRDRRPAARRGPRAGRPADHRRRGPHEVPGQGGQRGRQAGRPAGGAARRRSWRSCIRCRSSGCGASARSPPPSCASGSIRTVGDVARVGEAALVSMLGAHAGRHLHALAHNHDPRRVRVGHRRGSIGSQCALGRRAAPVRRRSTRRWPRWSTGSPGGCAAANRAGRTVTLRLRFGDFTRATRSRSLLKATMQTAAILATARALLAEARPLIDERGLTLVGVAVSNLDGDGYVQLELPFDGPDEDKLDCRAGRGPGPVRRLGRDPARSTSART